MFLSTQNHTNAHKVKIDDLTYFFYIINDQEAHIGGFSEERKNAIEEDKCPQYLTIPETVDIDNVQYTVTAIGKYAFFKCSGVKNVSLPGTIKVMETSCLDYLSVRCDLKLPESLISLGDWALSSNHFPTLTIPKSLTQISEFSFAGLFDLQHLILDQENPILSTDSQGALYNKQQTKLIMGPSGATKYTVLATVQEIGAFGFAYHIIQEIVIPESVKTYGISAFKEVRQLKKVTFKGNLINIPDKIFNDTTELETVYYYGSVAVTNQLFDDDCIPTIYTCYKYEGGSTFAKCPTNQSLYCLAYPHTFCSLKYLKESIFSSISTKVLFITPFISK